MIETNRIYLGDCLETMKSWPDAFVQTCVTSPPYFALRDYGVTGQIGLEETPEAYIARLVEVFREVRRVLRDDATLWLNIGDSYNAYNGNRGTASEFAGKRNEMEPSFPSGHGLAANGLKPKDMIGIPWSLAKALQQPYYTGRIKSERDRAWLAAMIDGEGTITASYHIRKDDGRPRTAAHVCITNSSTLLLDEAARIFSGSRSEHQRHGEGHLGKRDTWRWIVHGNSNKILLLREALSTFD